MRTLPASWGRMHVTAYEKSKTLPRQCPVEPMMMYRTVLQALVAPAAHLNWDPCRHIRAVFWDGAHPVHLAAIIKDLQAKGQLERFAAGMQFAFGWALHTAQPHVADMLWALYRMGMRCSMFP